jgi:hypothetical protein
MTATVFTEAMHPMAPLLEAHHNLSIDEVIIAASQTIVVGQVLGAIGVAADETLTVAAAAGNVGDGTVTPDATAPVRSDAKDGAYSVVFLTTGATAEFEVTDPDGQVVGTGAVGTGFAGPIKFSIADDSSHHYTVGDRLTMTVLRPFNEAGEQFEAWSPTATDGSQTAVAVAMYPVTTGAGQTAKIAAVRRDAAVRASDLTWASGATTAQIQEGQNQLAKKSIVLR